MKNLREASKDTGVVYETALSWIRRGLLKARGAGRQKVEYRLSSADVERLRLLGELRGHLSWGGFVEFCEMVERDCDVREWSSGGYYALVDSGRVARISSSVESGYVIIPLGS